MSGSARFQIPSGFIVRRKIEARKERSDAGESDFIVESQRIRRTDGKTTKTRLVSGRCEIAPNEQ